MRKIGYARVSAQHQNLDRQLGALVTEGCDRVFQEKASGRSTMGRPQREKAIAVLGTGASATASGLPDNLPATTGGDGDGDLPVPVQKASAHARVYDDAGPACVLRYRRTPCCLLWDGKHRHPELVLRRSIPRLRTPL